MVGFFVGRLVGQCFGRFLIEHPLVHELEPTVPESDGRQADVFVRGMSIGQGLPVVGDMTLCMS